MSPVFKQKANGLSEVLAGAGVLKQCQIQAAGQNLRRFLLAHCRRQRPIESVLFGPFAAHWRHVQQRGDAVTVGSLVEGRLRKAVNHLPFVVVDRLFRLTKPKQVTV